MPKPKSTQYNKTKRLNLFLKLLIGLLTIIIIAMLGLVIWGMNPSQPDARAIAATQTDDRVSVIEEANRLQFLPANGSPSTGLIFYPGGHVDYRAYAPLLREISASGYAVYLVKMPLSLAVLGVNRANEIIAAHPEVEYWFIGGHSLGGSMAAAYIYSNPVSMEGLVLWAAYPAESNDLSKSGFPVLSIFGNQDGLVTLEELKASALLLPTNTTWVEIDGGNHAQFGSYGSQRGDLEASIPAKDQQLQIVNATIMFLSGIQ